jgi:hypothetical protein
MASLFAGACWRWVRAVATAATCALMVLAVLDVITMAQAVHWRTFGL